MFPLRCIHPSDCPETPAAGARSRETGVLESVGANGDYYSSSSFVTGNNNAGNLWFNATGVNPLNNGTRAWHAPCAASSICTGVAVQCPYPRKRPGARSGADHGSCQRGGRFSNPLTPGRTSGSKKRVRSCEAAANPDAETSAVPPSLFRGRSAPRGIQSSDCHRLLLRASATVRTEP